MNSPNMRNAKILLKAKVERRSKEFIISIDLNALNLEVMLQHSDTNAWRFWNYLKKKGRNTMHP
jgi:hypothetical protein